MAPPEPLSYDEIHGVSKRERSTRALTKVSQDFYERLRNYVADARAGLEEESARGPSPRLVLLQGQFRNLEEMAREIALLRLRKVTELAFAAVEGGSLHEKLLTPEEMAFATQVQAQVEAAHRAVLGQGPPPAWAPAPPKPVKEKAAPTPPEASKPAPWPAAKVEVKEPPSVVVLRILDDIPPFEGEDSRVYRLKREDVITLPRDIAQILVRRKKAVELEVPP